MKKGIIFAIAIAFVLTGCASSNAADASKEDVSDKKATETVTKYEASLPTGEVESDIFVTRIDGIKDEFLRGIDISSLLSLEASGVKYYDFEGNEADLFKVLADAGVNSVRVRVWNDPFDENGNGYGGGNCTVDTACEIGKRAAMYGISTCVDFHYSDFWADPSKQMSPKAWTKLDIDSKVSALKEYTIQSLDKILDEGADVVLVQIGNETNSGIAGVKSKDNMYRMIASGCEAVNEINAKRGTDIKSVVHFTQIDNYDDTLKKAEALKEAGADYDVFGVSYYPYWHGTMENMEKLLKEIHDTYGVDTCVMETSYPYTTEDGDGFGNSISGDKDVLTEYPTSVQGQAKAVRDVMNAANNAGALGVYYWEGAWIPADSKTWETNGSGWASSYAKAYDPDDAGKYYGGCSWDNQALFDFEGKPLESLNVFKYVKYGAKAPLEILAIKDVIIESPVGISLDMPQKVTAVYNDSDYEEGCEVNWNEDDLLSIDVNVPGRYTVRGTTSNGTEITANIKIMSVNYLENYSFEDEDTSMWEVNSFTEKKATDIQDKSSDAMSGNRAFHYWSPDDFEFTVSQTVDSSVLHAGTYTATTNIQGGDMGDNEEVYLYVLINGEEYARESTALTGWVDWKTLTISDIIVSENDTVTVGVYVKGSGNGWGTIDDFELY